MPFVYENFEYAILTLKCKKYIIIYWRETMVKTKLNIMIIFLLVTGRCFAQNITLIEIINIHNFEEKQAEIGIKNITLMQDGYLRPITYQNEANQNISKIRNLVTDENTVYKFDFEKYYVYAINAGYGLVAIIAIEIK
jgi:hypothetical protein